MPENLSRLCYPWLFMSNEMQWDRRRGGCGRRSSAVRSPAPGAFPFSPSLCPRSPARWQHFWAIPPAPGGGRKAAGGAGVTPRRHRGAALCPAAPTGTEGGAEREEGKGKGSVNVGPRSRTRCLTLPSSSAWPLAARRGGWLPFFWGVSGMGNVKRMYPGVSREPSSFSVAVSLWSICWGRGAGFSAFLKPACSQTELANLFGRWELGRESGSAARCRGVPFPELL